MPVVEARGVSKQFLLRHNRYGSLKERFLGALHPLRRERVEDFFALRDLTLSIESGEAVGLVGRNGSGKSTFLRLVAGIIRPTAGSLAVLRRARIGTMIELGVGFHGELTGRENVFLNAAVHGLSRRDIERIYDKVVDYSELHTFMDVPMKNYSSGMVMRLGFSVAANLDPDLLLLDEVFAVGDEAFQRKCMQTMQAFRAAGKTILFVSHSAAAVRAVCDRVCVLDGGRLVYDGSVSRGLEQYERCSGRGTPRAGDALADGSGGWHRQVAGGRWAEAARWTHDFLRREGLRPDHYLLEVGCGSLGAAAHLLPFMEQSRYWGFEMHRELFEAGVQLELPKAGVCADRGHFIVNGDFDLSAAPHRFDYAIAQGLLPRINLNRATRCIAAVLAHLAPGGRFYLTWFDAPAETSLQPVRRAPDLVTYPDSEPYHYSYGLLERVCEALGARTERLPERSHPRGESVMVVTCQ